MAQGLTKPLVWVEIMNPYDDKEFLTDRLSIVDVKANDSHEQPYQIKIQLTNYWPLHGRIIYNWTDINSQQLKSGQGRTLNPHGGIWLLELEKFYAQCFESEDQRYETKRPAKRQARGYRNINNFINMVCFLCGKLKFDYPLYFI